MVHYAQIVLIAILLAAGFLACGARSELFDGVREPPTQPPDASVHDARVSDQAVEEPADAPDTAVDAPFEDRIPPRQAPIFVSSRTQLYGFFPDTREFTLIGQRLGCSSLLDIAASKAGYLYATFGHVLFRAGLTEFPCVVGDQWPLQTGNALTTVPAGVMSPNEELVYIDGANYGLIRLAQAATPHVEFIRELVTPDREASGDLVYLARGVMVATMTGRPCGEHSDCLIEFDPRTGALQKDYGPIGVSEVYALTEYQGTLYGFTGAAQVLEITFINGSVSVTEIATKGAPADGFTGATLSHP